MAIRCARRHGVTVSLFLQDGERARPGKLRQIENRSMKKLTAKPLALIVILVAIIVAGALAWLTSGEKSTDKQETTGPKSALTVDTVRPSRSELPIRLAANGNIQAWQEALIGSELNGLRLAEVLVNVGDRVKAGQVLARFAGESVAADLAQANAGLLEAEANAAEATGNADRARKLESTGALSAQQIQQFYTVEQTAKARVASARAGVAAQQLRMKHVQVVAPDDGIISDRKATVGAVAGVGTELFRLIRKGRLEWRAEVTSAELGRIATGSDVSVRAANGTTLKGKVRMIAPTVDPQNRVALVYVDLPAAQDKAAPAKAGMFARGEFSLGTSGALTVPQQAVVMREGFNYVFQLNPENRVAQVKVQTGRRIDDRVEILEGLKPDATVVANGAGFLNDGDLVRVATANGANGAVQPAANIQPASLKR
jgi:RND family efflux transporter MFP subunit